MNKMLRTSLAAALALFLFCACLTPVFAAPYTVTQTSMVRALEAMLGEFEPNSTYTAKSSHGGASGNLGFAQELFYRLFLTELSETADLSTSTALTTLSVFRAADTAQAATLEAAMGALRFGDVIQYGALGHVSIVLGEAGKSLVVYDCGFADENLIALRCVEQQELSAQALTAGNEGGLSFYRAKNVPTFDITLTQLSAPNVTSYYLEATPVTDGLSLEYYSAQTGRLPIAADNPELKVFVSTQRAGKIPMLLLYGSAFTFTLLEVKDQVVESVLIEASPTKLAYTTEQTVDMTGAIVSAVMRDGTKVALTEEEYTLTYAFTAPGPAVVTVSYGGKSDKFNVTVSAPPVLALRVNPPTKTTYFVGERLELDGASLIVDYETKTNQSVELLESMLSAYDTTTPGEQVITVTYGEMTAEFTITVVENKVSALRLSSTLPRSLRKGAMLDINTIELLVIYENGQTRTITAADCVVSVGGKETATLEQAGTAEIVFSYQGVSTGTVAIEVTEDPMEAFLRTLIILLCCLIGIPLLVLLIIFLIRRFRTEPAVPVEEPDADDDTRVFVPEDDLGDTVHLPRIPVGVPSDKTAGEDATIPVPPLPKGEESPTIRIPQIKKPSADEPIDFFDEL